MALQPLLQLPTNHFSCSPLGSTNERALSAHGEQNGEEAGGEFVEGSLDLLLGRLGTVEEAKGVRHGEGKQVPLQALEIKILVTYL